MSTRRRMYFRHMQHVPLLHNTRRSGLRVGGRLALLYIHQMNRVNSRNDLVMMTAL